MSHGVSRRYFFFGTLLAGAVPPGGLTSAQSLKRLGYKSPNEKLNLAAIGGGGQAFNGINDHRDTRPHAPLLRVARHAGGQVRIRGKTADPDRLGSPPPGAGG